MIKQALVESNYEVEVAIGSLDVNVNYDYEFIDDVDVEVLKKFDLVAIVAGYRMYYYVTGKKVPKRTLEIKWKESTLRKFVDSVFNLNKVIVAPFIVPAYLAKLGYLKGRKCTVYPTTDLIQILIENGAEYINELVVKDGNVITMKIPTVQELVQVLKSS